MAAAQSPCELPLRANRAHGCAAPSDEVAEFVFPAGNVLRAISFLLSSISLLGKP